MNKKVIWAVAIFGIVAIAIGGIVYFNLKSKTAKDFVPADSDKVLRINFSELQKIVKLTDFTDLASKADGFSLGSGINLVSEVLNVENAKSGSSGLDLKSEAFFFSQEMSNGDGQSSENNMANGLVFSMKDKSVWENFLKTKKIALQETNEIKVENTSNCQVFHSGFSSKTYAWNSEVMMYFDDVVDNVKLNSFFGATEDKAIKLPQFKKFMGTSSHLGIYIKDFGSLANGVGYIGSVLGQQKVGGFATYVNFENGKVKMDGEMLGNKESMKQFDLFSAKPVSKEMLALLPDANPSGFFSFHLDMEKVLAYISKNEAINTGLRMFLSSKGLTINDVKQIFNGEVVFTISFINPTSDEFMGMASMTPQMHLMIGSNNPDKLKGVLDDLGLIKFGNNAWQAALGSENVNVVIKNKAILITNNDVNARNFNDGFAGIPMKNEVIKSGVKSSANYIYFDLKEFLMSRQMGMSGFLSPEVTEQIDYMEMKGDYSKMEGTFYFNDKTQNSLKTIMGLLNEIKNRPAFDQNDLADSMTKAENDAISAAAAEEEAAKQIKAAEDESGN